MQERSISFILDSLISSNIKGRNNMINTTIKTVRIFSLSPEKGTKKKQRILFGKAIRKETGMKLPNAIMMAKGLMKGKELGDFFGKEDRVAFEPGGRVPYFYLEGKEEGIRIID